MNRLWQKRPSCRRTSPAKKNSFVEVFGASGKIVIAGLGEKPDAIALQTLGGTLARKLFKDCVACFYVEDIKGCKLSHEEIAHNVAFGLMIGSYRFDKYFTKKRQDEYPNLEQVIFKVKNPEEVSENFRDLPPWAMPCVMRAICATSRRTI